MPPGFDPQYLTPESMDKALREHPAAFADMWNAMMALPLSQERHKSVSDFVKHRRDVVVDAVRRADDDATNSNFNSGTGGGGGGRGGVISAGARLALLGATFTWYLVYEAGQEHGWTKPQGQPAPIRSAYFPLTTSSRRRCDRQHLRRQW
jgi:hypothetical protein